MSRVRSEDIETGAVNGRILADSAIQRRHLGPGVIGAGQLGSGAVSGDAIATGGVQTGNLSDGVVTAPKVGDGAIEARKIRDGAIEVAKFAASLRPVQLVDTLPALPDDDYPAGAVVFHKTEGKLYRNVNGAWTAAVPTGDLVGTITETQITDGAISTPKLAANAVTTNNLAAGSVTADQLAANSVIAGKVQAGAISTDELAANAITADKVKANAIGAEQIAAFYMEVGKYIRSSNYVAGSAGWAIDADGNVEFNDGTFRGDVVAGTFRTGVGGERVEIGSGAATIGQVVFHNANGAQTGFVGNISSTTDGIHVYGGSAGILYLGDPLSGVEVSVANPLKVSGDIETTTYWVHMANAVSLRRGTGDIDEIQSRPYKSTANYRAFAAGQFRVTSSKNFKNNIRDSEPGAVARLSKLRTRRFRLNGQASDRDLIGFIAEELPAHLQAGDGYDVSAVLAECVQAIQELADGR